MLRSGRELLGRAKRQVTTDLDEDPYLLWVLVLSAVLAGFWFWHRIPNFATRDEKSRLLDALVGYGSVVADPTIEGLREGVLWGRVPFGATFYLFAVAVLPVVLVAALVGQIDAVAGLAVPHWEFGFYPAWQGAPEWLWTWSLVFVRLGNVAFAVGAVYLTYRLGVATRDRATGRLAALLLTLTFGFLTIAHEGGEDMPALFFVLLALYLLVRYVQAGDDRLFFAASAAGGVAIAFKLTAAPVVALIGVGYLLRARATDWPRSLVRPKLLVGGAALGALFIVLGFPTLLVGGVDRFLDRFLSDTVGRATHPTGPDAPIWWWFLRGYFSALGLPLFVAAVGGVLAAVGTAREEATSRGAVVLIAVALFAYLLVFSRWHDFRVHHLLPTFPLLALLLAGALVRFRDRRPALARPLLAVLLVTTGIYAAVGTAGFAAMPRDQADAWLVEEVGENETLEVYRRDFQDAAVPHGLQVNHLYGDEGAAERVDPCPEYVELGYRDLLYLKDGTYYRNNRARQVYVRELLEGGYGYEIAAEFGPRPPNFVPQRPTPGSLTELLRLGVIPQTDQFADEQELAANQYTVILELTGECHPDRNPPF
jgi:hypothetical protein